MDLPTKVPNFSGLAAIAIAINLAYLNLGNVRYTEKFKNFVRIKMNEVENNKVSRDNNWILEEKIRKESDAYKEIYRIGRLDELNHPVPVERSNGERMDNRQPILVAYLALYLTSNGIMPLDKIISASFLVIATVILYASEVLLQKITVTFWPAVGVFFFFLVLTIWLLARSFVNEDRRNRIYFSLLSGLMLSLVVTICFWLLCESCIPLQFIVTHKDWVFSGVLFCVLVPTLMVVFSKFSEKRVELYLSDCIDHSLND